MGMALMGMCVVLLLSIVADHLYITRKLKEKNTNTLHAINKTEEACLGILGGKFEGVENKKVWSGKTGDGLPWKVVEQASEENEGIFLYDVTLADIYLQGVRIQNKKR